ncbi:hypothetical protein OPKNFCMD_1009 [Methylobacterium crusticola]|uniref:Cell wall hydrolase SleB domain-containing protein n=1 Tax=Methylobacterium crusticola TaxID=1697972 RepID=A0ABQ4QUN1_9HYPH|nr:cell wall hydrolase [Methylobacterium crusticola]GJD48292.1 hypothetical protein OPKNFCMD_1009 [Methylobacterium crusticola]
MKRIRSLPTTAALAVLATAPQLGGCGLMPAGLDATGSIGQNGKPLAAVTTADRDCLARAMYFESNRSSEEGLLAVGTVVMNRLDAPAYPNSICGVVGQPRQFAAGVLHKPMRDKEREKAERVADAILSGERHDAVGDAKFFHTAGYRFSYRNMHYVALAGGNAFYEKRPWHDREGVTQRAPAQYARLAPAHAPARQTALAELGPARNICRVAAAETGRAPG